MESKSWRTTDGPWNLPFKLIKEITRSFSEERKLGSGTFGQVYKGVFPDGEEIAVKMLQFTLSVSDQQFQNEFENLKRLNHKNIVRLLGFCNESEQIVVLQEGKLIHCDIIHTAICLEYMPNGSLAKFLSGEHLGNDWPVRYRIIKGICEGLKYLHEGLEVPVLHLDLKPDNILLDQDKVPKIADFGLSRLLGEEKTIKTVNLFGTLGYLPPEFIDNGIITKEYDIFSLGVIIKKIIAGIKGNAIISDMDDPDFFEHVYNSWRKSLQERPNCASVESDCKQIRTCIEISIKCMDKNRRRRPKINDIISQLNEIETVLNQQLLQHLGTVPDGSNAQWLHMQHPNNVQVQQSQDAMVLMQAGSQQNQRLQSSQHHIVSQFQSTELQQPLCMLQHPSMRKKLLTSASTLGQLNNNYTQMQYIQAQMDLQEVPVSTSAYHTAAQTNRQGEHDMQDQLAAEVACVQNENVQLKVQIDAYECERRNVDAENAVLRAHHAALAGRLEALGGVLEVLQLAGAPVDIPEIPDPLLRPWQPPFALQPIAVDAFQF